MEEIKPCIVVIGGGIVSWIGYLEDKASYRSDRREIKDRSDRILGGDKALYRSDRILGGDKALYRSDRRRDTWRR